MSSSNMKMSPSFEMFEGGARSSFYGFQSGHTSHAHDMDFEAEFDEELDSSMIRTHSQSFDDFGAPSVVEYNHSASFAEFNDDDFDAEFDDFHATNIEEEQQQQISQEKEYEQQEQQEHRGVKEKVNEVDLKSSIEEPISLKNELGSNSQIIPNESKISFSLSFSLFLFLFFFLLSSFFFSFFFLFFSFLRFFSFFFFLLFLPSFFSFFLFFLFFYFSFFLIFFLFFFSLLFTK